MARSKDHLVVKSDDRRDIILNQLADYVLANGLAASSLRPMAKAMGLSDRMLLYYFKDKEALIEATLARIVSRLTARLSAHVSDKPMPLKALATQLTTILLTEDMWPYVCVWLEIAALAARGDAFYRAIGSQIGEGFLAWGSAQLDSLSPQDLARDAKALLIQIEGTILLASVGIKS
jgi:AcrR family transcriptional regulator